MNLKSCYSEKEAERERGRALCHKRSDSILHANRDPPMKKKKENNHIQCITVLTFHLF